MTNSDLLTWAANFETLQAELDNYEGTLADITTQDPAAPGRAGGGQLVAFQLARILPMFLEVMQANPNPAVGDIENAPAHAILASRYFLEMVKVKAEDAPLPDALRTLKGLATQLHDTAARWADAGVNPEEKAVIAKETKEVGELLQKLGGGDLV